MGWRLLSGTSPRITTYKVVYIFSVGRYDIDAVRVYLPLDEAQKFFNRIDAVDEFEILVDDPQKIADFIVPLARASGVENIGMWSWQDANGGYLDALQSEDNVIVYIAVYFGFNSLHEHRFWSDYAGEKQRARYWDFAYDGGIAGLCHADIFHLWFGHWGDWHDGGNWAGLRVYYLY